MRSMRSPNARPPSASARASVPVDGERRARALDASSHAPTRRRSAPRFARATTAGSRRQRAAGSVAVATATAASMRAPARRAGAQPASRDRGWRARTPPARRARGGPAPSAESPSRGSGHVATASRCARHRAERAVALRLDRAAPPADAAPCRRAAARGRRPPFPRRRATKLRCARRRRAQPRARPAAAKSATAPTASARGRRRAARGSARLRAPPRAHCAVSACA